MTVSLEGVIAKYMELRDKKDKIKREAKEAEATVQADIDKLETYLLAKMNEDGVTSYKTRYGTAFKSTTDFVRTGDWDEILEWIKTKEAWHLLEKRVNKIGVRDYIDNGVMPPGITYEQRVNINIRKPSGD